MQEQRIRVLLEQYISGQLTEIGQQELSSILANPDYAPFVKEELRQLLELSQAAATGDATGEAPAGDSSVVHPILERVLSIDKTEGKLPGKRPARIAIYRVAYRRWVSAAAVLLTAGSVGYYAFHTDRPALPKVVASRPSPVKNDIAPGSNRAVLTLAGGNQIVLNGAKNGVLTQQGNTRVVKLDNGQLAYDADGRSTGSNSNVAPVYNTVTTPRGGEYQVILPDGTKVWLNAASSLRFPTAFSDKDRTVQVTGEAYFEVAADKDKPFVVQAGETRTRVLGTHFDVMAYGDEKAIRTTLLEGSVRMDKGGLGTLLKPGEQGAFDGGTGVLTTKNVNVNAAIAWKDGYYYFDRTKMEDVMRQISRWYDVDIVYQGSIPQDEIVGKIPRTAHVSEVLHIMELIGIHFQIDGKKIIVLS
jgi:ferric-dicitrate binding protein FerR (iron transport regulator)